MNVISFADALSEIKSNNPDLWNQLKGDKGDPGETGAQGPTGAPGVKAEIDQAALDEAVNNQLSNESTLNTIKDKMDYDNTISNINSALNNKANSGDVDNKVSEINNSIANVNKKFEDENYLAYINNKIFDTNTCYLNFCSLFGNSGLETVKEVGNNTYIVCQTNGLPNSVNMSTSGTREKWQVLFSSTLSYISYNQSNLYSKQIVCSLPYIYKEIDNPLLATIQPGTYACAAEITELGAEASTLPKKVKMFEIGSVSNPALCKLDYISYNMWCNNTSKSYINSMIAYCRTNQNDIIWFNFFPDKSLYTFKYYIGVIKNNDKLRYLTI